MTGGDAVELGRLSTAELSSALLDALEAGNADQIQKVSAELRHREHREFQPSCEQPAPQPNL